MGSPVNLHLIHLVLRKGRRNNSQRILMYKMTCTRTWYTLERMLCGIHIGTYRGIRVAEQTIPDGFFLTLPFSTVPFEADVQHTHDEHCCNKRPPKLVRKRRKRCRRRRCKRIVCQRAFDHQVKHFNRGGGQECCLAQPFCCRPKISDTDLYC